LLHISHEHIQVHSFDTVYCMNFVTRLNYILFSIVQPLNQFLATPLPGYAPSGAAAVLCDVTQSPAGTSEARMRR